MTLPASQASLAAISPTLASWDASPSHGGHYQLPSPFNMSPNSSAAPSQPGSPIGTPLSSSSRQQSFERSLAASSPTTPLTPTGKTSFPASKIDPESALFDSPWAKPAATMDAGSENNSNNHDESTPLDRGNAFSSPTSGENLPSITQTLEEADTTATTAAPEATGTAAQTRADTFRQLFNLFGTIKAEEDHGIPYE